MARRSLVGSCVRLGMLYSNIFLSHHHHHDRLVGSSRGTEATRSRRWRMTHRFLATARATPSTSAFGTRSPTRSLTSRALTRCAVFFFVVVVRSGESRTSLSPLSLPPLDPPSLNIPPTRSSHFRATTVRRSTPSGGARTSLRCCTRTTTRTPARSCGSSSSTSLSARPSRM